jgi:hypothetical protein
MYLGPIINGTKCPTGTDVSAGKHPLLILFLSNSNYSFLSTSSTCRGTTVTILVIIGSHLCIGNSVVLCCIISTTTAILTAHKDDDNFMMVSWIGTVEYRFQIKFSQFI